MGNRVEVFRTVDLPKRLDCPWAIAPGAGLDPAVFVKYTQDGSTKSYEDRALWDYRIDIADGEHSYYVLSTIPKAFGVAVNGFFGKGGEAGRFIEELGKLGIAIGGEALKSGRHALGVIGLVGTIRMINGTGGNGIGAFTQSGNCVGFLIPVDPFSSFFGKSSESSKEETEKPRRTDFLAIQLVLPKDTDELLGIYACGIESKFVTNILSRPRAIEALKQAQASLAQFRSLVEVSLLEGAMPERLGLLGILRFGLRITSLSKKQSVKEWIEIERQVFEAVLQGRYNYKPPVHEAVVVSTEGQLNGAAESTIMPGGLRIRLNQKHWPGISDSHQLDETRIQIARIFGIENESTRRQNDSAESMSAEADIDISSGNSVVSIMTADPVNDSTEIEKLDPQSGADTEHQHETVLDDVSQIQVSGNRQLNKVLLGVDDSRRPVFFDCQSPIDPLDNLNLMVTGSSGTGKTQFLKYLICKIREQGINVLIVDFKNDFASDSVFTDRASLERIFVTFDGLPYNPLIPYPIKHPETGESLVQIGQHISGVSSVLKRTYKLGSQQQVALKNAIVDAYQTNGIQASGVTKFDESLNYPNLNDVGETLHDSNINAFNRLDPLFTLDLFRRDSNTYSFKSLVNRSLILDLSQIPNEEIRSTLAELVVLSAHAYYNSQPHSGTVRQLMVFDEAHHVLESNFMTNLVRECRAYGVGTVLSSQYPSDFPGEISSSMATRVIHGNGPESDRVRAIVQLIGCKECEADISSLDRFQAFVDNRHSPHTLIRTMNYPLHLVYSHLVQHGEFNRTEITQIDGIDIEKLPLSNIIRQLERLGLAEDTGGLVRILNRYD